MVAPTLKHEGHAARVRAVVGIGTPIMLGALSSLGFEPLGLWPITFLAIAFLLDRIAGAPTRRAAFATGWLFAAGHFLVGLNWIPAAFTHQQDMPASFGIAAVVLLSSYLALFPALGSAIAWRVHRGRTHALGFVLLFAALWTGTEWLRGVLFTGFAWNPLGTVWLAMPPVAQAASWIGVNGLSGVLIVAAGALWLAYRREWRTAIAVAAVPGALAMVFMLVPAASMGSSIPVRIVQPNIGEDEKHDAGQAESHDRIYERLSRTPMTHPRLLLWPEAATTPHFIELEPGFRAALARLLEPGYVLLTGGESVTLDAQGEPSAYHNSVFAIGSNAGLLWRYDKAHLVPFGEYLPLRPLLERIGLSRLVPGEGDFNRGEGPRTFDIPGFGAVGVQVCYEIIFPGHVVDGARRPAFLFNPSNDAWFGAWGPPQHFAQARMRAIEEGLPVVRATPTGISGVIGPDGAVVARLPPGREGVLDADVPAPRAATVFARWGLWASGLFTVVLGAAGLALARRRETRVAGLPDPG